MELAEGGSLRDLIGSHLAEDEIVRLIFKISEGIKFLHQNNIIHLDLKPENILFDKEKRVKICDFGLSLILGLTIQNPSLHSVDFSYAAPEAAGGDGGVFASDIWSLGVVLFELCTGKLSSTEAGQQEFRTFIRFDPIHPFNTKFSPVLFNLFRKMLQKILFRVQK